MRARIAVLKRLVTLYGMVEEMRSVELKRTTAAVREAQQAIVVQQQREGEARLDSRDALMSGDCMGREIAEIQRQTAGWRRLRLDKIRVERETLSDAAQQQYLASRLKSEQMKSVAEGVAARVEMEERRRTQGISDDRFLARRRWNNTRKRMPIDR
jgi:hypothetical protein